MNKNPITKVSVTYNVAVITLDKLPNNLKLISDIFNSIAQQKINVDMISQSPPHKGNITLSFTIPSDDLVKAITTLNNFKKMHPGIQVEIDASNVKVSVYGESMANIPGVAAKLFTMLADNNIEINLVTTSEVDISYLISDRDVDKAVSLIKKEYNII